MRFITRTFCFLFFLHLSFAVFAQDETPCQEIDNKKAKKAYEQGIDKKNKKEERLAFLKQAIDLEPDYVDANFAFAMERIKTLIYADQAFKPTEPYFKKVIELCPKYHSNPYYFLGFIAYEDEKWDESVKYLKQFLDFKSDDDKKFDKDYDAYLSQAKQMVRYAKVYGEILNHPVPFDPHPVEGICTEKDEYLPIISADDEIMWFTRKMPYVDKNGISGMSSDREIELFSYSKRDKATGKFTKGNRMPYPFNKNQNEGGATLSIDNKHMYFTVCKDEGGEQVNCDIYHSDFVNGEWTDPAKVENINDPDAWDSQPTIASDGVTLYFSSNRKGGLGGCDIYKTVKDLKTGMWGKPENMGRTINTSYEERSPFMHSDFQTLYFSSDGHPGVGGLDIFYSRMGEDGKWTEPKNIGVPINTKGDDLGFFVSTDGTLGYFASNEPSRSLGRSVGKYDIFSFELYKDARPQDVSFLKGKIEDKSNAEVKSFTVEVTDAVTKKVTFAVVDSTTGDFAVVVNTKVKNDLIITAKKDGYAFSSQLISKDSLKDTKPKKVADIVVDTIAIGKTYALNNIYYNTNSAILDPRSMIVIEEFVDFLKTNPTLKIEIHGHTDNVGKAEANLALSTDRAFTVRDILLEKGIDEKRLLNFKGFGSSVPIADNTTEAGRSKNRRTEFVIVGK
jgi:outer membrane protein OmpA-like peptidoglycan-associated protein